jgi:hypothetical protein
VEKINLFPDNVFYPNFISVSGHGLCNLISVLDELRFKNELRLKRHVLLSRILDVYYFLYEVEVTSSIVTEKMLRKYVK